MFGFSPRSSAASLPILPEARKPGFGAADRSRSDRAVTLALRRRSSAHPEVLVRTRDPAFHEADLSWRWPEFGIGDQLRFDELDNPSARLDRAGLGGEDVLDPLHVGPIGQIEEVVVASSEHVHRRAVETTG